MIQRRPLPPAPSLRGIEGKHEGVASPCVNVCRMNATTGYCEGCLRTIDEIACWSGYTDEDKLAVIAKLAARRG
jgi:predicted Fe-S protein YdhL (DUF1289 family)